MVFLKREQVDGSDQGGFFCVPQLSFGLEKKVEALGYPHSQNSKLNVVHLR